MTTIFRSYFNCHGINDFLIMTTYLQRPQLCSTTCMLSTGLCVHFENSFYLVFSLVTSEKQPLVSSGWQVVSLSVWLHHKKVMEKMISLLPALFRWCNDPWHSCWRHPPSQWSSGLPWTSSCRCRFESRLSKKNCWSIVLCLQKIYTLQTSSQSYKM